VRNVVTTLETVLIHHAPAWEAALRTLLAADTAVSAAAIRAALTLLWSNGPVEGTINRLKMIKRSMYGRAKLDLLRQRVLVRPAS